MDSGSTTSLPIRIPRRCQRAHLRRARVIARRFSTVASQSRIIVVNQGRILG